MQQANHVTMLLSSVSLDDWYRGPSLFLIVCLLLFCVSVCLPARPPVFCLSACLYLRRVLSNLPLLYHQHPPQDLTNFTTCLYILFIGNKYAV